MNSGIYNSLFGLRAGAPLVIMDRFRPDRFAELVARFGVRSVVLPPAAIAMLNASDVESLAPLRYVRSITAPLSPTQARLFKERFGVFVLNSYGQAEVGEVVGWTAADAKAHPEKVGAAGRPHDGVAVRVVGPDGAALPVGEVGSLRVKTLRMAAGYATGEQLSARIDADGYLETGDLGRVDADGFVWIEGRAGILINRGGNKVFPEQVEEVLELCPAVAEAAVVGVPDERLGEVPVALVVDALGVSPADDAELIGAVPGAPGALQGAGGLPPRSGTAADRRRQAPPRRARGAAPGLSSFSRRPVRHDDRGGTVRAVRLHGPGDVRVEDLPEPAPGPGEVKLRNSYAGICGSDVHVLAAGLGSDPHPLTGAAPPQVLGHEFSGTVVEVGEGVTGVAVGDRVAVYPAYSCGTCAACTAGRPNVCRKVAFHGLTAAGGGMAEFTTIGAGHLHLLPDAVDLRMGALVEPMAVAWHAVRVSGVTAGGSALIAGAGPIGLGLVLALRAKGVERIVVSEPNPTRRAAAERLGVTVVDPVEGSVSGVVADLTGGAGVDVGFDAAGAGAVVSALLAALQPGGRAVVVAIHGRGFDFNPTGLVMGEKELVGALAYLPEDFDAVIAAMAEGHYDLRGWVEESPLADALDALHRMRDGHAMKVLLTHA